MTTATSLTSAEISSADRLEIFELYSRYFCSLDGLRAIVGGEADLNWADTFTADGEFSVVRANGDVLANVRGTAELVKIYATLRTLTTRHWTNNLLMCPMNRVSAAVVISSRWISKFFRCPCAKIYPCGNDLAPLLLKFHK